MLNDRVSQWMRSVDSDRNEHPTAHGPEAFELIANEETQIEEPGLGPELSATESDEASEADLAELVAEVGAVLKSAQEAATRIRDSASAEASKVLTETRRWVESEFAATWREAAAVRAEAEAFAEAEIRGARQEAEALRAEAQALQREDAAKAEQVKADAEHEAQSILEAARQRLLFADAEIEEKLRRAEAEIRARRDALESEAVRHREWLESMLGAFQGISLQIQGLLEAPRGDRGELLGEPSDSNS
jgi:ElaB/YqjD/DUF883 family membrane-anchored ribosome-binding protein